MALRPETSTTVEMDDIVEAQPAVQHPIIFPFHRQDRVRGHSEEMVPYLAPLIGPVRRARHLVAYLSNVVRVNSK